MKKMLKILVSFSVLFSAGIFAADSAVGLTTITSNVNNSVIQMAVILSDIALIAGIGFIMASFFKFHQHKLNPTQIPLSNGLTLLLIGAGLTLFPTMLPTAKKAIFGGNASVSQVGGGDIKNIIGNGNSS